MDVHVDTNEKPGLSHGKGADSPGIGLFRRRVVFELDAEQLPLLEAAEARHGSKRAALIAALAADGSAVELLERTERAEAQVAKHHRGSEAAKKGKAEDQAKLKQELAAAKKKLAKSEKDLAKEREHGGKTEAELREGLEELREAIEERDEEIEELQTQAVAYLRCLRCKRWVPSAEWSWGELEDGGAYAFHEPCGDHEEGLKGSSWLALRD